MKIKRGLGTVPCQYGGATKKLCNACLKGDLREIRRLIEAGADVDAVLSNYIAGQAEQALLHWAIQHNKNDIAKILIEKGADVNKIDNFMKWLPIDYAISERNYEIFENILEKGICFKRSTITPLHKAVSNTGCFPMFISLMKYAELVEQFINIKAKYPSRVTDLTPLSNAVYCGDVGKDDSEVLYKIKSLINIGADLFILDSEGKTALYIAKEKYGESHIITTTLIKMCIEYICKNNRIDLLHSLICKKTIDPNMGLEDNISFLHMAAQNNCDQIVRCLILYGAEVDTVANNGETPLHIAVKNGNLEAARALIENGANISKKNNNNDSPISVTNRECKKLFLMYFLFMRQCFINLGIKKKFIEFWGIIKKKLLSLIKKEDVKENVLDNGLSVRYSEIHRFKQKYLKKRSKSDSNFEVNLSKDFKLKALFTDEVISGISKKEICDFSVPKPKKLGKNLDGTQTINLYSQPEKGFEIL